MSLQERTLPTYTLAEELCNSISHGVGALLGIAGLVLCVLRAAMTGDPYALASAIIYGVTLILLYTMSATYHGLKPNNGKRVLRIIDHCSIFLLIAGTYTPYTLVVLRQASNAWGWGIFGVVWGAAVLGIVLNSISLEKFKVFSMICYLAMGWAILLAIKPLLQVFRGPGLILLLAGGIAYTVGSILYGLGKKIKFMHSVFHLFVLMGSLLHFFSILLYVYVT